MKYVAVCVADKQEWNCVLDYYQVKNRNSYIFGEYFIKEIGCESLLFYHSGTRKTKASAATQYMIDHFDVSKIIMIGTCIGIAPYLHVLDIVFPTVTFQADCFAKEFAQEWITASSITISHSSKQLVLASMDCPIFDNEARLLAEYGADIGDMEGASVAYIANLNDIPFLIIKGVSDIVQEDAETQICEFEHNVSSIMKDILENYLSKYI